MNRDTITGLVGAAILVVAMVGVFQYERSLGAQAATDPGDLTLQSFDGPTISETTALGEATDSLVNITHERAANVTFTLTWSGASTNTLSVALDAPDAVTSDVMTDESDTGTITITVAVPQDAQAAAASEDWKVSVAFVNAAGTGPSPLPPPAGPDASVTWTLTTSVEAWAPAA